MQDPEVLERLLAFKRSAAENSPTTWQEDNGLDVEQLKIGKKALRYFIHHIVFKEPYLVSRHNKIREITMYK